MSPPLDIDAVLTTIGEFGPYQRRYWFLLSLAWLPCGVVTLQMVFVEEAEPEWEFTEASWVDGVAPEL